MQQIDIPRQQQLVVEIERTQALKDKGQNATLIASLLLSALPIVGGPASFLASEYGKQFFETDLVPIVLELARSIETLSPEIQKIAPLEDKLAAISEAMKAHAQALEGVRARLDASASDLDTHFIDNAGSANFVNVTIRNLRLQTITRSTGTTNFKGVDHEGPSHMTVEQGGRSITQNSTFTGRSPRGTTSAHYNAAVLNEGATVEHGQISPSGQIEAGLSVSAGEDSIGLSISPEGVSFGSRAR